MKRFLKIVLRIIVVIAIIVGIVFGVRYCTSRKSIDEQLQASTEQCFVYKDELEYKKDIFYNEIGALKDTFSELDSIMNTIKTLNSQILNFAGEIYLVEGTSNETLTEMKAIEENMKSSLDNLLEKMESVRRANNNGVDNATMNNLRSNVISKAKTFRLRHAEFCSFIINYVKEYARNNSENDDLLNTTINIINKYVNDYKEAK